MTSGHIDINGLKEAQEFLNLCGQELNWTEEHIALRLEAVEHSLRSGLQWEPTSEELQHGARVAWRNHARCIGRIFWNTLIVRDRRNLNDPDLVAEDLREHIRLATNGGMIKPLISIYAPADSKGAQIRIWNHQLFGYAGYGQQANGQYLGDPKNEEFTRLAQELGWQGQRTCFDLLPWIIQKRGEAPKLYPPPEDICLQVALRHPEYEWFADLGLKWYAVPIISDMKLRVGGVNFSASPFNGWYMGTEIGARDLGDEGRYGLLPEIGRRMGLLSGKGRPPALWKDRALLELNEAVLHSFSKDSVRVVDHHRADSEFMTFVEKEKAAGRLVSGRWSWLVPPMSGSTTEVFHRGWKDLKSVPDYQYQDKAWESFS